MELRQLHHFVTIHETGSFSEASQLLFVSQQGLSMSIKRLETELGCPLFVRSHKGISLTKDGEYLYAQAKKILKMSDECTEHFQEKYHSRETIHVAISAEILGQLPFELQQILRNTHPDYNVQLHMAAGTTCESYLDKGECSLGFICGPIDHTKYRSRLLQVQEYSYIVNKAHPLAQKDFLTIYDFKNQPLIFPGKESKIYTEFSNLCKQHGFKPNYDIDSPLQTYTYSVIKQNSTHIGQLLDYYAQALNDPSVKILKLTGCELIWRLYLVSRNNYTLSEKEKSLQKLIFDLLN